MKLPLFHTFFLDEHEQSTLVILLAVGKTVVLAVHLARDFLDSACQVAQGRHSVSLPPESGRRPRVVLCNVFHALHDILVADEVAECLVVDAPGELDVTGALVLLAVALVDVTEVLATLVRASVCALLAIDAALALVRALRDEVAQGLGRVDVEPVDAVVEVGEDVLVGGFPAHVVELLEGDV